MIGSAWVVLPVAFEISLGGLMGYSWERLGSDYNTLEGGLLPIGFVIMATSPLIAARLRGCRTSGVSAAALQGQSWGPSRSTGGAQNRQAEAPTRRQPGTGGRA